MYWKIGLGVGIGIITSLIIALIFILKENSTDTHTFNQPTKMSADITPRNTIISWLSEYSGHNSTYFIRYNFDNSTNFERNVTGEFYTLSPLKPCSILHVELWAVNSTGHHSEKHLESNFTDFSTILRKPEELNLTHTENGLHFTWTMPVDLGNCEISYQVKICGDLEDECITEPVYENFIEIPESLHCTEIIVGVGIEHQGQIGPLSFKTYDARTVTGLKIGSQELGRLHAEWNPHPKQEYCSLKYRVMCTDGDKTKFSLDIIGTDADLDEELCNGKITVMAVRDYTEKEPDDKSPNKELHL